MINTASFTANTSNSIIEDVLIVVFQLSILNLNIIERKTLTT